MTKIRYVAGENVFLKKTKTKNSKAQQLLLGARLHIAENEGVDSDGWIKARSMPNSKGEFNSGFVKLDQISDHQQLKIFYLDVGQGDASLIEAEGAVVIIDGGPNQGLFNRLKTRLKNLQRADKDAGLPERDRFHINAIIISHFDQDHYAGLTNVLKSDKFSVDRLYHNGLPRYGDGANMDLDLGSYSGGQNDKKSSISTDLRDINSARTLVDSGLLLTKKGNLNNFGKFLDAAIKASEDGRLDSMNLLVRRNVLGVPEVLPGMGNDLKFEVLGPISTKSTGQIKLPTFPNPYDITEKNPTPSPSDSHTINGNSIVLQLRFGTKTFLFGGDLNQPAQKYLASHYNTGMDIFKADVSKACHHGSSDFDIGFLKAVNPHATVFSSGDNGSHDHPLPDAMGAAAKQSRGEFPLVFSTELARETGSKGIKFGHINARSNGDIIVMAQKKEKPSLKKTWYTFTLPFTGPFNSLGGH